MFSTRSDVMGVFFFSFANAKRDLSNEASPGYRLDAIKEKLSNLPCNTVFICASEYNRELGDFSWKIFNDWMKMTLNFVPIQVSLQGTKEHISFGNIIYVRQDKLDSITNYGEVDLVPSVQDPSSFDNNKAAFVTIGDKTLMCCHLTLSFDEESHKTKLLVEELTVLGKLIADDHTIVVGDFNLVPEMRAYLRREHPSLLTSLHASFGGKDDDISFLCMPHDHVPVKCVKEENIVLRFEDATACVVSALDVVCGKPVVCNVTRFLPYGHHVVIPLRYGTEEVVGLIKKIKTPPCGDWVSDHFPLFFEFGVRFPPFFEFWDT